jgi:CRP-like cAMP-binding protein
MPDPTDLNFSLLSRRSMQRFHSAAAFRLHVFQRARLAINQSGASPMHTSFLTSERAHAASRHFPDGRSLSPASSNPPLNTDGIPDVGKPVAFAKRQIVFHHGDPATHLYWVQDGAVMVQQYLEDGRRQLVDVVLAGGICGFSRQQVYSATCETLQPTILRACRKSELERHGELGWAVSHQIERQLCAAQEHALALGRMTAQEKVCVLLCRFAGKRPIATLEKHFGGLDFHIQLPMTRGEIGDYLGLSLETVCRTLTDLQRKGVIGIGQHHGDIAIFNMKRLQHLAGTSE